MVTRAAIYIRKSREEKDKSSQRLTVQREQLPAYATAQGWTFEVYDDGHASAARAKLEDLKERARLEKDIRARKVDILLVIELSRLSRDESSIDYVAWLSLCADHGVKLATPSRILDPAQHSDWILLFLEGGLSSTEMKVIQDRMREGRKQAFSTGKFLGGDPPPPYVYDPAQKKPVVQPDELKQLQKVWSLIETMSAKAVAKDLGLPEIRVRRVISDERLLFCQALRTNPENGELIHCEWDPCLDAQQAARIRGARRTRKTNETRREHAAFLSNLGLVFCGYCGRTVKTWRNARPRKDGSRLDYYGCQVKNDRHACINSRLVPQKIINDKVLTNLFSTLDCLEEMKKYWLREQDTNDPTKELIALANQEEENNKSKGRLVTAIADGVIQFEDAKIKIESINANIEEIKGKRHNILSRLSDPPDWESLSINREEFETLDEVDQREFVRLAIDRIDLYRNYAIITYPFPRQNNGDRSTRIHLPISQRGRRWNNLKATNHNILK